jgi:cytochrome c biogenesis protein
VGPSVQYKLRDPSGQAREFNVYQLPVELEGQRLFLAGIRDNPNEGFRYLRIPVDENDGTDEFFQLRAALVDQSSRALAAERFAARVGPGKSDDGSAAAAPAKLAEAARKALELFADGGMTRIAEFLDKTVPRDSQQRTAAALAKLLNNALWELRQIARDRAGQPAANTDEAGARWLEYAQNALSDLPLFDAPLLTLTNFTEIKASVLQVTRSPGKKIVYLGCLSLVLGVFAMFYIRERRLWCWLTPAAAGATQSLLALSASRPTIDLDGEFQALSAALTAPT